MILLLDSSTGVCRLIIVNGGVRYENEWQADRALAKGLLRYLHDQLKLHDFTWTDITAIGVFRGPGSFTGLRIGMSVLNTIASSQGIPIVGTTGDDWENEALAKLDAGINEKIILPEYGGVANITKPRK